MTHEEYFGFIPASGQFNPPNEGEWWEKFVLPQGISGLLSSAGWTRDNLTSASFGNEGFIQQTFLGASIRDFNLNAGFGDSTSTLSLNLVNDEFNISDATPLGHGDDPYHGNEGFGPPFATDAFQPPPVGTPVFFKFGKNPADIEQAFRQTFDDLYKVQTLPIKITEGQAAENAWGYPFPRLEAPKNPNSKFGPDFRYSAFGPYILYDEVSQTLEDRSSLWNPENFWRGRNHFVFGGILQSYTENKGPGGKPVYSVNVNDPREILSNVQVLLNNYQGTTFNNKNIINLYGFLEYDPSTEMMNHLKKNQGAGVVEKLVDQTNGNVAYAGIRYRWDDSTGWEPKDGGGLYVGDDLNAGLKDEKKLAKVKIPARTWTAPVKGDFGGQDVQIDSNEINLLDQYYFGFGNKQFPEFFPITGQGFSRRSDRGMPWYRIDQGLAAIFNYHGAKPSLDPRPNKGEFDTAGFGGQINFRGFNYVVDFSGIPTEKIPLLYYMEFDKIDLLSLAQELCDIISHELFVSLLPVINHPSCEAIYKENIKAVTEGRPQDIIAGIIRLDAIDKTNQPRYGAIKSYLDLLSTRGIDVANKDVGFELSNVTTDKFVAGGQVVDMHLFSTERDRDELLVEEGLTEQIQIMNMKQWDLRTQLQQQAIPYYGLIGEKAVSIPRGFGGYQQILLDSSELNAFGVGNQYIATEMELRAALVDFKTWKNFLLSYNDTYIEDVSQHNAFLTLLSDSNDQIDDILNDFKKAVNFDSSVEGADKIDEILQRIKGKQYAVTVPRCVFRSDKEEINPETKSPASPCSPPFGYPLYYKRATRIGIVEAGVAKLINAKTRLVTDTEKLKQEYESANSPLLSLPNRHILSKRITDLEDQLREFVAFQNKNNYTYKDSPRYKAMVSAIEEAKKFYKNWDDLQDNLKENKDRIAEVERIAGGKDGEGGLLDKFLYNIDKTAKKHEENAKKVFEFVKRIAEECLGKKFLVRLPKAANLNYDKKIKIFDGSTANNNIEKGPFGFPPIPIHSDPNYGKSGKHISGLQRTKSNLGFDFKTPFHHYLMDYTDPLNPVDEGDQKNRLKISETYDNGALKGNFNPFSEKWEWNYMPEPQGGYFTYDQFGVSSTALDYDDILLNWGKLPLSIQQGLCPMDVTNFMSDSNRMQCYVKYENSHLLDFGSIDASDMSQQSRVFGGIFMPDVTESLPNNNESKPDLSFSSLEDYEKGKRLKEQQPESMAFVKCTIDENIYLPPKLEEKSTKIYARNYEMKLTVPEPEIREVKDPNTCAINIVVDYPLPEPIFSVPDDGGWDGYPGPSGETAASGESPDKPFPPNEGSVTNWTCFKRRFDKDLDADIIVTDLQSLDDDHAYALVTLPGRVKSTADIRWKDGPLQAYKTVEKKHLMMQDTVFLMPEFNKPTLAEKSPELKLLCGPAPVFTGANALFEAQVFAGASGLVGAHYRPTREERAKKTEADLLGDITVTLPETGWRPGSPENWVTLSLGQITEAKKQTEVINKGFIASQPQVSLGYISPSPIVPDMFALPLMSMERCYGPWLSASQLDSAADARIKYSNIGGKVEFVKDEELAPWNFAGYQLLNQAGSLQANFSNSLLLFSERGGFVMPDAPTGIALATTLQKEGPLITSIGISVGQGGVETTVKLDLYTSQFGKLAKQKEMAIGQIARERQRLVDEKNASTRRGLGKRSTSTDLVNKVMSAGGDRLLSVVENNAAQREVNKELSAEIDEQILVVGKDGGTSMSTKEYQRILQSDDPGKMQKNIDSSVAASMGSLFKAYSDMPNSQFAGKEIGNTQKIEERTNDSLNREQ